MTARERTHWIICCSTLIVGIWLLYGRPLHADDKSPIPSGPALDGAMKLVEDVFGDEHAKARSSEEKTAFAEKLLQTARKTEQGTANHYALLRVAWDVATRAGDANAAIQITDAIAGAYEVDVLSARVVTVKTTAGFVRTSKQNTALATVALEVVEEAVASDKYDSATELTEIAVAAARKAREWQIVKQIVARGKAVTEMAEAHAKAQKALATLENDPTNPEANQAAGEYYCFVKGDWTKGIPMLALGTDAAIKALALSELQTPASASEQAKLGDGWWVLGEKHDEDMKHRLRSRAAYWYRQAAPNLSGLVKQKYERRLEQIGEIEGVGEEKIASPATDGWIDALAAVDVSKHGVKGSWSSSALGLMVSPTAGHVVIPFAPIGDYDIYVSFTRQQGVMGIGVVLPVASRQCLFAVSANRNKLTGIECIQGKTIRENPGSVPGSIVNNQKHELELAVRQRTGAASIVATLDGRPHYRWEGPPAVLSIPDHCRLPSERCLGLASTGSAVITFHEVKVKAIRGRVQKLTDGTLAAKPPGEAKQPAVGALPRIESAAACTKLEAKKPPVGLTQGAIAFDAPRGDGRRGANGFLAEAASGWETRGTAWACTYRRAGDSRGVQFIHPFRTGHIVVTVSRDGLHVGSPGKWPNHGFTPTRPTSLPLAKAANFAQAFNIEADPARSLLSILGPQGRYQFFLDGQLVAGGIVPLARPLQLTPDFKGAGLPMALPPGMSGAIIGPQDSGENRATNITFGLLVPKGR